jgi:hypothetical protein
MVLVYSLLEMVATVDGRLSARILHVFCFNQMPLILCVLSAERTIGTQVYHIAAFEVPQIPTISARLILPESVCRPNIVYPWEQLISMSKQ